jgi:hypothetical protein
METQNKFEGWAVVELFGHAKAIGFVTTECYGQAVLFRVDTPELPEREFILDRPAVTNSWIVSDGRVLNAGWTPAGSKVRRAAVPGASRLVGPAAIYSIVPCTEETAREAIDKLIERPLILLEPPKQNEAVGKITWPTTWPVDEEQEERGSGLGGIL